jgi:hypothetical protein
MKQIDELIEKYIARIKIDYPEDDKLFIDLKQFANELLQGYVSPEQHKEDLSKFLYFLKSEGIVIESENKPQDFEFLYSVWSGENPDGLNF